MRFPDVRSGSVATFNSRSMGSQELGAETVDAASSGGQFEELVNELNLTPNISTRFVKIFMRRASEPSVPRMRSGLGFWPATEGRGQEPGEEGHQDRAGDRAPAPARRRHHRRNPEGHQLAAASRARLHQRHAQGERRYTL